MLDHLNLTHLTLEDVLDSRDLEDVIDRLETEQSEAIEDIHDGSWDDTDGATMLDALRELRAATEGEGWTDGIVFIRDAHFEDYARELADDLGLLDNDTQWPHTCIDWQHAARELQYDYSAVSIGGVTYWYREA